MKNFEIVKEYLDAKEKFLNIDDAAFVKECRDAYWEKLDTLKNTKDCMMKKFKINQDIAESINRNLYDYLKFNPRKTTIITARHAIRNGQVFAFRKRHPLKICELFNISFDPKNEIEKELIKCIKIFNTSGLEKYLMKHLNANYFLENMNGLKFEYNFNHRNDLYLRINDYKSFNLMFKYYEYAEFLYEYIDFVIIKNFNDIVSDINKMIKALDDDYNTLKKIEERINNKYPQFKLLSEI